MKSEFRLKKTQDFDYLVHHGTRYTNPTYTMYVGPNTLGHSRYGISVSKKRGNAVVRNKIRRQIREIIRKGDCSKTSLDYVVIAKDQFLKQSFLENTMALSDLFLQAIKGQMNK